MRYKNIFFDLDGTLTDSGEGIMNSAIFAFEQLGVDVPDVQDLRKVVGPPLGTSFALLGVPDEQIEEAIRLYRDKYNNHGGKYQNHVYPGIEGMLKALQSHGFELYVATSKPENLAREILKNFRLDSYFEYIAGATIDHSRESKGDVLKYLLGMTGSPADTVMVGDTIFDVAGAHEQNIPCIGVSWGYGDKEDMQGAGAEYIADSPEELLTYLSEDKI